MNSNQTKLFAVMLTVTTAISGGKPYVPFVKPSQPEGLHLVEFKGLHKRYDMDDNLRFIGSAEFLGDTSKHKGFENLHIDTDTYKKFKLRIDSKAPNRVAIIEIGSREVDGVKRFDTIVNAKAVNPDMKDYWQSRITKAQNDPEKIFGSSPKK